MKMGTKRTLYLTKAEKKALTDFYWNFYYDDDIDNMFEVLETLARNTPENTSCEIKITD